MKKKNQAVSAMENCKNTPSDCNHKSAENTKKGSATDCK